MADKRDYYEVLNVPRDASEAQIKKAYRQIAFENHPDRNPGDTTAEARFKEAADAYAVLGDPEKRAQYDRFGHSAVGGQGGFSSVDDIFTSFGDIFEEVFGFGMGGMGGRGGRRGRRVRRGADLRYDTELTYEDAAEGLKREIEFVRRVSCEDCEGKGAASAEGLTPCVQCGGRGVITHAQGFFAFSSTCPRCQGKGQVVTDPCKTCQGAGITERQRTLMVNIPAGVDHGSRIRVRGEGEPGPDGGPPGDLYVFVHLEEHPIFDREDDHLICRIPISYAQASLGATLEVPTLDGRKSLKIPAGTQPGETFVLRGEGFPRLGAGGHGDEIVQVFIQVPRKLSKRQKELLRELSEEEGETTRPDESLLEKFKRRFRG